MDEGGICLANILDKTPQAGYNGHIISMRLFEEDFFMKRALALLCALAMLISVAVSCGKADSGQPSDTTPSTTVNEETTTAQTTPAQTEPPKAFDTVSEENLGGYVFNILYTSRDEVYYDFLAETINGDVQNDAIFQRNAMVEEKLNVDLQIAWKELDEVNTVCRMQVQSGTSDFDLFGGHRKSLALSYEGMQYNINDISTINLSQEWWDQDYIEAITIHDSLYTVIGDIGVSTLLFISSMTFNKRMLDEANIAYPYDLVREGKWTLDALQTMLKDQGADLNGDGKMVREDDHFALLGWATESAYSLFYGADFAFINRDATGEPQLEYDTDKLNVILEKVVNIWNQDNVYLYTGSATVPEHEATYAVFAEQRAMFSDICLCKIGWFYTDMEDAYGIVPIPKLDEAQESYHSYLGFTIPVLFLPANASDPERTGLIMEACSAASYDVVTPQMYEIVTKLKNARDEDSSEMIEIIIRNKFIDTAHFYDIEGYGTLPTNVITSGSSNSASIIKAFEKIAKKEWDKIITAFDKLS